MASANLAHRIIGSPVTGQSIPRRRGPRLLEAGELNSGVDSWEPVDTGDPIGGDDYQGSGYDYMTGDPGSDNYEKSNPALQADPNRKPGDDIPASPLTTRSTSLSRHSDTALTQAPPDSSQSDLHYFGDPYKDEVNPVQRYQKALANPPNPQSSWWRRLLGGVIDTAGTWGQGFGVPRGVTHHLAQDVRYGADAAHEAETYYQQLPLQRESARTALEQQKIDQRDRENQQRQDYLNLYHQQQIGDTQDKTRLSAEGQLTKMGGGPAPTPLPPITASAPLMRTPPAPSGSSFTLASGAGPVQSPVPTYDDSQTPDSQPVAGPALTTGGMSAQQQLPAGSTLHQLPASPSAPAATWQTPPAGSNKTTLPPKVAEILGVDPKMPIDPNHMDSYLNTAASIQRDKGKSQTEMVKERTEIADQSPTLKGRDRETYIYTGHIERPPTINIGDQEANDPEAIKAHVDDLKRNPDTYFDIPAKARGKVAREWTKQTGLPPPVKLGGQDKTREIASQSALQYVTNVRSLLNDPAVQKRLGPALGRLGNAEQDVGATVGLKDDEAQKIQDFRSALTYLFLGEGRALFGGRPPEKLMKELQATSPRATETLPLLLGQLNSVERVAKSNITTAEKARFGGKTRPGFTPGYDASDILIGSGKKLDLSQFDK